MSIFSNFVSESPQNTLYFYVLQLKMLEMVFQKVTSSALPVFFAITQSIQQDIALKFNSQLADIQLYSIYCVFLLIKIINLQVPIYFTRIELLKLGCQNRKHSKIYYSHFVERSIIHSLAPSFGFYLITVLFRQWRRKVFLDGRANIAQGHPGSMSPPVAREHNPFFYNAIFTDIGAFFKLASEFTAVYIRQ